MTRFNMRLTQSPRDRRIASELARLIGQGANVSELVKNLLYAHLTGAQLVPATAAATAAVAPGTPPPVAANVAATNLETTSSGLDMSSPRRRRSATRSTTQPGGHQVTTPVFDAKEAAQRLLRSVRAYGRDSVPASA
jgi:hypothetical protein